MTIDRLGNEYYPALVVKIVPIGSDMGRWVAPISTNYYLQWSSFRRDCPIDETTCCDEG
jgi:hypothetical protein